MMSGAADLLQRTESAALAIRPGFLARPAERCLIFSIWFRATVAAYLTAFVEHAVARRSSHPMLTKKPCGAALGLLEHGHKDVRASYDTAALGDCAAWGTLHDTAKGGGRLGVVFVVYYELFQIVVDVTGEMLP